MEQASKKKFVRAGYVFQEFMWFGNEWKFLQNHTLKATKQLLFTLVDEGWTMHHDPFNQTLYVEMVKK